MGEPLAPLRRLEPLRPRSQCRLRPQLVPDGQQLVPDGPHGAGCRLGHSPPPVAGQQSEPRSSHQRGRSDPPQTRVSWSSNDPPPCGDDPTGSHARCGHSKTRAGCGGSDWLRLCRCESCWTAVSSGSGRLRTDPDTDTRQGPSCARQSSGSRTDPG